MLRSCHSHLFLRWWAVLALGSIWMRLRGIVLAEMALSSSDYTWLFFRGSLADILATMLLAVGLVALHRHRYVVLGLLLLYMLCLAGNSMSVIANDENLDFTMAGQTTNATFVLGVIFTPEYMNELLHVVLGFFFSYLYVFRLSRAWVLTLVGPLVLGSLAYPWLSKQPFGIHPSWASTHVFEHNLRDKLFAEDYSTRTLTVSNISPFFARDLDAPKIVEFANPQKPPNVLMIIVESVGQWRYEAGWLPYLKSLGQQSLVFDQYYTASQVTSNGLHALFCADNPGVINHKVGAVKAWKISRDKESRFCLPQLLSDAGYATVFMAPASLSFQNKKTYMPKIGFQEMFGKEELLPIHEKEDSWGKDDLEFYYYVYDKIRDLDKQKDPWFLTALTVTTHHPAVLPDGYLDRVPKKHAKRQATEYADMALKSLLKTLDAGGYLDHTLVIITNDEVRHRRGKTMQQKLRRNHGMLTIMTPNKEKRHITKDIYSQTDMMLSVADYLGLPTDQVPMGRSYFRDYKHFRPFFLTHYYSRHIMVAPDENRLIFCQDRTLMCQAFYADAKSFNKGISDKNWDEIDWNEKWKDLVINISQHNDQALPKVAPQSDKH